MKLRLKKVEAGHYIGGIKGESARFRVRGVAGIGREGSKGYAYWLVHDVKTMNMVDFPSLRTAREFIQVGLDREAEAAK